MSRPKKCKICTSDLVITGRINAMLEAHVKLKAIAAEIPQFSVSQLSRHRNKCLASMFAAKRSPETRSAQIEKWLARAEEAYVLSSANSDSKGAIAAVNSAVRALSALEKQLRSEAEVAEKSVENPNRSLTIADLDKLVADFVNNRPKDFCYSCGRPIPFPKEQNVTAIA